MRWSLVLLVACTGGSTSGTVPDGDGVEGDTDTDADADSDTDTDTDTDTDADTDTGTIGYAQPTSIEVTCAPTSNPLRFGCTVTVDPAQPVEVHWSRTDGLGPDRLRTSDGAEVDHELTVLFLAPQQEYEVRAAATAWPDAPVATTTLTAGAAPPGVGSRLSMTGTATTGLLGTEAPCSTDAIAVVYDTATGDLVWFQQLDPGGELSILHMVRFTDEQTVIGETSGDVVEVELDGTELTRFPTSYPGCCGLNHDIFRHGSEYWSQYQNTSGGLTLDNVVVLDATGTELYQWDPADHLSIPGNAWGDYLHTNTEFVDANGDFYLSWLMRDAVGKFNGDRSDPDWGDPIWLMTGDGQPGDLGNDITLDWTGISPPHEFEGQHNLHLTRDGRVMLLDNGNGRGLAISVDEKTMTGTVDAEYPTHERSCGAQGTAMDTWSGHVVVACATEWVREYDAAASLVWEAEIECLGGTGGGWTPGGAARWYPLDAWE